MLERNEFFTNICDEFVKFSEYDPELALAIKWIDEQARKKGITYYDMVFEVLYKNDIPVNDPTWVHARN
jgi:hypothetical protein